MGDPNEVHFPYIRSNIQDWDHVASPDGTPARKIPHSAHR